MRLHIIIPKLQAKPGLRASRKDWHSEDPANIQWLSFVAGGEPLEVTWEVPAGDIKKGDIIQTKDNFLMSQGSNQTHGAALYSQDMLADDWFLEA
jgi:hypothetical protein